VLQKETATTTKANITTATAAMETAMDPTVTPRRRTRGILNATAAVRWGTSRRIAQTQKTNWRGG
jgi:hypothetical protein